MLFKGFVGGIASEEDREIEARDLRITSKGIAQSHKLLDQITKEEAYRTWQLGKELGLVANTSEADIIQNLENLEHNLQNGISKEKGPSMLINEDSLTECSRLGEQFKEEGNPESDQNS
ncbi:hypothetical protein ACS0TY_021213 [Phlomoides rotata]